MIMTSFLTQEQHMKPDFPYRPVNGYILNCWVFIYCERCLGKMEWGGLAYES